MKARVLMVPALAVIVTACNEVKAGPPDTSNPFHCGVAFSMFYGMAKSSGSPHEAMMQRRLKWAAEKAASLPATKRSHSEGEALMKRLMADQDEAAATVVACMTRQDRDPAFRAQP